MGNQSSVANWTMDDWAYGTGENAVSAEEVFDETRKIPLKYFGGEAIENDASMHQMQRDLLSFDDKLKRIFFRRKKNKRSKNNLPPNEYYYEDQQSTPVEQPIDSRRNENYLPPIFSDGNAPSLPINSSNNTGTNTNKITWRCTNCTIENKTTDHICRRCGQVETRL